MRILSSSDEEAVLEALQRGEPSSLAASDAAMQLIAEVSERGDDALVDHARRFDSPAMSKRRLAVDPEKIDAALDEVEPEFVEAAERAIENLRAFHARQLRPDWFIPGGDGMVGQRYVPIERVGLYVPGGAAPLCSTLIHLAVPAQMAGVSEIAVCTPAQRNGSADQHVLAVAALLELDEIYLVGGASAVAALAIGTETIPKVDFIAGPGNDYVTAAKRLLFGMVGIDSLAGPTEVIVIADEDAEPAMVAADLLAQAEHPGGRPILLTDSQTLAEQTVFEVRRQLTDLPTAAIASESFEKNGVIVVTEDVFEALQIANLFAPEHLELLLPNAQHYLGLVENAGAVFLGPWSPEALGDYVAGPSHVLPTDGTARFASPVGVETFLKRMSLIAYGPGQLALDADAAIVLARAEGLEAHARSLEIRFQADDEE
ncbi:MAG: histidinol dehydrogenase [Armatimonadetes bacterium]|nr:histidinol dehydrogenase [Armatimonadota bacterium]